MTIDIRSDAITQPTNQMWDAMQSATVGWALPGEDKNVEELEAFVSDLVDKEVGLYLPSGTTANLLALLGHSHRGDQIILDDLSHILWSEEWGFAKVCGLAHRTVSATRGQIDPEELDVVIGQHSFDHRPRTALICLENTQNMCFGAPINSLYMQDVFTLAKKNNLKIHTDGARIFNAAVALNSDIKELVQYTDSITFCLSKGLSAPIGSMLCGTEEFIHEARRMRKALGGGMRQAGIIAASGQIALHESIKQLKIDHDNAQYLAQEINKIDYLNIEINRIKTNILYFTINHDSINGTDFVNMMYDKGIKFFEVSKNKFRLVTHSGICHDDVKYVIKMFNAI